MSFISKVMEFHEVFGHPIAIIPAFPDEKRRRLRLELIREEVEEYFLAEKENSLELVADALGDIIYVVVGAAIEYGIPLNSVFSNIHESNMSKLGADGKPIYREDGKTVKGENYKPPTIASILLEYGWKQNGDN